ncbi:MAG TPA: hypothetical protein VFZ40_09155 [Pyrinomonadaceae bacterium]
MRFAPSISWNADVLEIKLRPAGFRIITPGEPDLFQKVRAGGKPKGR